MAQREDYWSDGATDCLIDAWGDHRLNRGNLRISEWTDVTDAVNRRQELLGKPRKTLTQCRNRIDTVKKKYKVEKFNKLSQWPHLAKFHSFEVGPIPNPNMSVGPTRLTFRVRNENPNPTLSGGATPSSESTENEEAHLKRRKWEGLVKCDGEMRQVADAVLGLGELYERVERANIELAREIERSRIEFVKEMEAKRLKFVADLVDKCKKHKR